MVKMPIRRQSQGWTIFYSAIFQMTLNVIKMPQTVQLTRQNHSLLTKESLRIVHVQHFWKKKSRQHKAGSRSAHIKMTSYFLCTQGLLLPQEPQKAFAVQGVSVLPPNKTSEQTTGKSNLVLKSNAGRALLSHKCCFHISNPFVQLEEMEKGHNLMLHTTVFRENATQRQCVKKST